MNTTTIRRFSGFSNILKEYESVYFTTHDDQFDNAGGFLIANGFKYIISQKDYPSAMVLSTLGVPDHSMFEYSIQKLNELSRSGKPFFSVFMTASDHGPYIIPPDIDFKPKNNDKQKQIVEYADWSIKRFLQLASAQDWFRNTVFAFIADHGAYSPVTTHTPVTYDMPLSYHHTPLIIYAPYIITQPRQFDCLGGQIDVFPTVMGILNFPYINNTFGIDLLREKRPYMYFSADDKIGCLDRDFFYVFRTNGIETLYKYRDSDTKNYIMQYKSAADSMKAYAFSMLQSAQWITENNKTGTIKF
jgi:phosphoglycerol transferase MdoB-like AlkP superfamily enzyme